MNCRNSVHIRLGIVLLLLATAASATIIGDLKTGSGGTVTLSATSITFNPDPSSNPSGPPWNGEVANSTNLTFAGCPSGVLGTAGCLNSAPFSPNEGVEIGNGITINFGSGLGPNNPFLQFAGNGVSHATLLYTATAIGPGSANTNCATATTIGSSCSPFAGSPLVLINIGTGTTMVLSVSGTATDGAGISNWQGGFSSTFAGMTPLDIANAINGGGSVTSSQSGDFQATGSPTVPEPASLLLMGTGLTALAGMLRRKLGN